MVQEAIRNVVTHSGAGADADAVRVEILAHKTGTRVIVDGVEATRLIRERFDKSRVLIPTSFSDQTRTMGALSAGADGYLPKHSDPEEIAAAIRSVHAGDSPLDPKVARALLESRRTKLNEPT